MSKTQGEEKKKEKRNFNALQRALEALKIAMETQLPKGGETGLESIP